MINQVNDILKEIKEIRVDIGQIKINTANQKEKIQKVEKDTFKNSEFINVCKGSIKVGVVVLLPIALILLSYYIKEIK